jgi:hypothetical protein
VSTLAVELRGENSGRDEADTDDVDWAIRFVIDDDAPKGNGEGDGGAPW